MKTKIRLLFGLLLTSIGLYSQSSDSKDLKNIRIDSIIDDSLDESKIEFHYESNTIIAKYFFLDKHYATKIFTYDSLIGKFIQYENIDKQEENIELYKAYFDDKNKLERIDYFTKPIDHDEVADYIKVGEYNYLEKDDTITITYINLEDEKKNGKIEFIYDNDRLIEKSYEYYNNIDKYKYTYFTDKKVEEYYVFTKHEQNSTWEFKGKKEYYYNGIILEYYIDIFNNPIVYSKQEFKENTIEFKELNWLEFNIGFNINIYEPAYVQYEKDPESGEWVKSYETFLHYSEITNVNSVKPIKSNIAKVYPNPFIDRINVNLESGNSNAQFILSDLQGKTIKVQAVSNGEQINLTNLSPGYYIYTITNNNQTQSGKLLKN